MADLVRAVCPFCSCLCNDLYVFVSGEHSLTPKTACPRARSGYGAVDVDRFQPELDGRPVSLQGWQETVAGWLKASRQPLVLIGGGVDWSAQQAAARLGLGMGACLDTPSPAVVKTMNRAGWLGSSLGEIHTVDKIWLLNAEPDRTHPRWSDRFLEKRGLPSFVYVNSRVCEADIHTHRIQFQVDDAVEMLVQLRLALSGKPGSLPPRVNALLTALRNAPSGAVLVGEDLLHGRDVALTELVYLLQSLTVEHQKRWSLLLLDEGVNRQGASDALLQVCGFPGTVRCDEGKVLFSSAEWSAERLLLKDECDLVLALGEIDWLSEPARRRMVGKRVIVLAGQKPKDGVQAWLPVKSPGIDGGGRLLRLDQAAVKVKPLVQSRRAEAARVLTEMLEDFS